MSYSSKDFGRTRPRLVAETPSRLLHSNVEEVGLDETFSGERKHPVFVVDLPSKTMSMTVGHLAAGQSTNRHRHTYETLIYVLEGFGRTYVEEEVVEWKAGDAFYVPVWAWHRHENLSPRRCRYLACENAPLLQNLGAALREEGP